MLQSSVGNGLKLRITSFALLLVPLVNNFLDKYGVQVASDNVEAVMDALFFLAFTVAHIWGWIRSIKAGKS